MKSVEDLNNVLAADEMVVANVSPEVFLDSGAVAEGALEELLSLCLDKRILCLEKNYSWMN